MINKGSTFHEVSWEQIGNVKYKHGLYEKLDGRKMVYLNRARSSNEFKTDQDRPTDS